jgi:hypothetical protein
MYFGAKTIFPSSCLFKKDIPVYGSPRAILKNLLLMCHFCLYFYLFSMNTTLINNFPKFFSIFLLIFNSPPPPSHSRLLFFTQMTRGEGYYLGPIHSPLKVSNFQSRILNKNTISRTRDVGVALHAVKQPDSSGQIE